MSKKTMLSLGESVCRFWPLLSLTHIDVEAGSATSLLLLGEFHYAFLGSEMKKLEDSFSQRGKFTLREALS